MGIRAWDGQTEQAAVVQAQGFGRNVPNLKASSPKVRSKPESRNLRFLMTNKQITIQGNAHVQL